MTRGKYQEDVRFHKCGFNPKGVKCPDTEDKCVKCGWNPIVEARRKEALVRKYSKEVQSAN